MNKNQAYFNEAAQDVDNRYFSADGNEWGADAWANGSGDEWSADAWANFNAPQMQAQQIQAKNAELSRSQPIIIVITNAATSAIANVQIYGSLNNRTATNFGQNAAITFTSGIPNVNYLQILGNSESKNFKVGRTMIISSTSGQIEQTVNVAHYTDTGDQLNHFIIPTIDPYQQQTDRIVDDFEYLLDGFTSLTFTSILASATVTVRLYLLRRFSATQIAAGGNPNLQWAPPNIVRFQNPKMNMLTSGGIR
jgi:hypothetical protein